MGLIEGPVGALRYASAQRPRGLAGYGVQINPGCGPSFPGWKQASLIMAPTASFPRRTEGRNDGTTTVHPTEPIPTDIANGGVGH
jgi:hypothetical protein